MTALTANVITVNLNSAAFELEKVDNDNGSDFYAIWDVQAQQWLPGQWVRVIAGAVADDVEGAFLRGELVSSL